MKNPPSWISTILMESTFKIQGRGSVGTAFIVLWPIPDRPGMGFPILITAAHVLDSMKTDTARLVLRRQTAEKKWQRFELRMIIRNNQGPIWVAHSHADVAAMRINLPKNANIRPLPISHLIDDEGLKSVEVRPGDELLCLGFPFGLEANPSGFPILRSGKIASYPILPTKDKKIFLFDFEIFEGNSGGPVFMMEHFRNVDGKSKVGSWQFIIGLVSKQGILKTTELNQRLGLGQVIHASLIKETIEMLNFETKVGRTPGGH